MSLLTSILAPLHTQKKEAEVSPKDPLASYYDPICYEEEDQEHEEHEEHDSKKSRKEKKRKNQDSYGKFYMGETTENEAGVYCEVHDPDSSTSRANPPSAYDEEAPITCNVGSQENRRAAAYASPGDGGTTAGLYVAEELEGASPLDSTDVPIQHSSRCMHTSVSGLTSTLKIPSQEEQSNSDCDEPDSNYLYAEMDDSEQDNLLENDAEKDELGREEREWNKELQALFDLYLESGTSAKHTPPESLELVFTICRAERRARSSTVAPGSDAGTSTNIQPQGREYSEDHNL